MAGSWTAAQQQLRSQFYLQNQVSHTHPQVEQNLQHQLRLLNLQHQQNQTQTTLHHLYPPPPYPHHLLQLQCHEGHGQSSNKNTDAPFQNQQPSANFISQSPTPPPSTMEPPFDETMDLDELGQFAQAFKKRRIKLGYTQRDVGLAMKKLYVNYFSQTTISRVEALNLSFRNMCKLKPLLEKWLVEEENSMKHSHPTTKTIGPKRKKRTVIEKTAIAILETAFKQNPGPGIEDLGILADNLGMEMKVVQVWFCNRRGRERRINQARESNASILGRCPPMHQQRMLPSHEKNQ